MIFISIIVIFSLVLSIISLIFGIHFYFESKKKDDVIKNYQKSYEDLINKLKIIEFNINNLNKKPLDFENKIKMVEFKFKKLEDIVQTFNNGFRSQESWM